MTDSNELPEDVRKLLREHIESYEELEILLVLRRERYEEWTPQALTARLHIPEALVGPALTALTARGLIQALDASGVTESHFAYRPASAGLDAAVGRLDREYSEQPIRIIRLMSANAIERVRTAALHTFADAFVLRKDSGRG